jgi:hypothetical protein
LTVGDNPFYIIVTAEDGVTTKTYTVTVHRASSDATLSGLTVSEGSLLPAFASATMSLQSKKINHSNLRGSQILITSLKISGNNDYAGLFSVL